MALQRLCAPGSDLQGSQWVATVEAPGFEKLALQHFYRTALFLAEVRSELETALSWRDRDLFSQDFDVMFVDTTSLYVYRSEETELFKRGYSRHHRPDLPQVVLCVVVNTQGWPWRGWCLSNTADVRSMEDGTGREIADRKVVVVADRGMIEKLTKTLL
jgi:transposase